MTLDSELAAPNYYNNEETDIELNEGEDEEEEEELEKSTKNETNLKKFPCPYEGCAVGFGKNNRLKAHIRVKHTFYFPFKCTIDDCEASFACQTYLNKHLLRHVTKDNSNEKKKKTKSLLSCDSCSEQFRTKSQLRNHQFKLHQSTKSATETLPTFNCDQCDASFLLKSRLNSHKRRHRGYSCSYPECEFRTDKWSELRKHLSAEHRKLECSVCRKRYSSAYNLRVHEQSIHGELQQLTTIVGSNDKSKVDKSKFDCPDCSKSYQRESSLKTHLRTYHSEEPRYRCPFENCERKFRHKKSLDYHLKTLDHSEELQSSQGSKKKKQRTKKPQTILNQIQKKSRVKPLIDVEGFDEEDRLILEQELDTNSSQSPKISVQDFVESNLFESRTAHLEL